MQISTKVLINEFNCYFQIYLLLLFTSILISCGGGKDEDTISEENTDSPSFPLLGEAVKGPLVNAHVNLFLIDPAHPELKGELIASGVTDSQASLSNINVVSPLHEAYLIVVSTNSNTTDLSTGKPPFITELKGWVTSDQLTSGQAISVTPLTTLAIELARNKSSDNLTVNAFIQAIHASTSDIIATFGFGLNTEFDIFTKTALLNGKENIILGDVVQYRTAIEAVTAIVGMLSNHSTSSPDELLLALASDLSDGQLDGKRQETVLTEFSDIENLPDLLSRITISSLPIPNSNKSNASDTEVPFTVGDVPQMLVKEAELFGSDNVIDMDNDGIVNKEDAFPLDSKETKDSDQDGMGDNADHYPTDSACSKQMDGNDQGCYISQVGTTNVSTIFTNPEGIVYLFIADESKIFRFDPSANASLETINIDSTNIFTDANGIIYLFITDESKIFRFDPSANALLEIINIDRANPVTSIALSKSHHRIYLNRQDGTISFIALTGLLDEKIFTSLEVSVKGLTAVGNYVLAQNANEIWWNTHYVFDINGRLTDSQDWGQYQQLSAWNPINDRVYFFSGSTKFNDLRYKGIDQTTGKITDSGEALYPSSYLISPPIRIAHDGTRALLGNGAIYDVNKLTRQDFLGRGFEDAIWTQDGGVIVLTAADSDSRLLRYDASFKIVENIVFTGTPIRIQVSSDHYAIITQTTNALQFHRYQPSDDTDSDGVTNPVDAFPADPAASLDSDNDGYPDRWNENYTATDSTTGLTLDHYPQDTACYFPEHGDGTQCDYASALPIFTPDKVETDSKGNIFLLSTMNNRVFRWSAETSNFTNPIYVGSVLSATSPTQMSYSPQHKRLYFGYPGGAITFIDLSGDLREQTFSNLSQNLGGLVAVGNYVLARDTRENWNTHSIFDINGRLTDIKLWSEDSQVYTWNPINNRVYFFSNSYPNGLRYKEINQTTGKITASGETPHRGDDLIEAPISIAHDGTRILLSNGALYEANQLIWQSALGMGIEDAIWTVDGGVIVLKVVGSDTQLRRYDASFKMVENRIFTGTPIRIQASSEHYVLITQTTNALQFHRYQASDDTDSDGVTNMIDAFPIDPAASLDSDNDGYPDDWNENYTVADNTTGLTLDSYPKDSACYLPEHGDESQCDYASTLPSFTPDKVETDGKGNIFLLSTSHHRVFHWSAETNNFTNPLYVGSVLSSTSPTQMSYSPQHGRLYFGYPNGVITFVDLSGDSREQGFSNLSRNLSGLVAVGNYVLAQGNRGSGGGTTHYIFDINGTLTDEKNIRQDSQAYAWNPINNRIYFFDNSISPNNLHYEEINNATGKITASGETSYHDDYLLASPIRIAQTGTRILLGSGDIHEANELIWQGSLGSGIADVIWTQDGGVIVLTTLGRDTQLQRYDASFKIVEGRVFTGSPIRIQISVDHYLVITQTTNALQFHRYQPNDDTDNDGITNLMDAFPIDPAASLDSDNDAYPDTWNENYTAADSTTGLTLDNYPQDSACYLPEHGEGTQCDYTSTLPIFTPDQVETDGKGNIFLLSTSHHRVFRWSAETTSFTNPIYVGSVLSATSPTQMSYSPQHERLYFGYASGAITFIDLSGDLREQTFSNLPRSVGGLVAIGNYVLAQDARAWNTHYVFDVNGTLTDSKDRNRHSQVYAWNPINNRIYFFSDGNPNGLYYEEINQTTGKITASGETSPYYDYLIAPPIRVAQDGSLVLLGSGDIYEANELTWQGTLGTQIDEAIWTQEGEIIALTTTGSDTQLRRYDASLKIVEDRVFTGAPIRIQESGDHYVILTQTTNALQFHRYQPSDDTDSDGIVNMVDAFPMDPAASLDNDNDGYPDRWNENYTTVDSTTGLTLDNYPQDAACYLPEHGDGTQCDYASTVPIFTPDQVETDGKGNVFLLSTSHHRVFRWSAETTSFTNPIYVGSALSAISPTQMSYSPQHGRLYFGYPGGAITFIDLSGDLREQVFSNLSRSVRGLVAIGNYVLIQGDRRPISGTTHYVFDINGTLTDSKGKNQHSQVYAWSPINSRIYFFNDSSKPSDLHYEEINQTTGKITDSGTAISRHRDDLIAAPIRIAQDDTRVLLGSGDIYDANELTWHTLGRDFEDAVWTSEGGVIGLTSMGSDTQLMRYDNSFKIVENRVFTGIPILIQVSSDHYVVITQTPSALQFHHYQPSDDTDNDGVTNLVDAFPTDPAASLDSDKDGYPDTWNKGYTATDSTTSLTLDSYPQDAACYLPEHGDGNQCDYASTLPIFTPDKVESDAKGNIFLLSTSHNRVFRWSAETNNFTNPIWLGSVSSTPTDMSYSLEHGRLYFAYPSGEITFVDLSGDLTEQAFTNLPRRVGGLAAVGNYLLARDTSRDWNTFYVFDVNGILTDSQNLDQYSPVDIWSSINNRVYFFASLRDGSANGLAYEEINQTTGKISTVRDTSFYGDAEELLPPIRIAQNGAGVLLGNGVILDEANELTQQGSLDIGIADAIWTQDGGVIVLTAMDNDTQLLRYDASLNIIENRVFTGRPIRIQLSGNHYVVITQTENALPFHRYQPSDDTDGDGIANLADAFPMDPAASLDSDHDDYPDEWHEGYSAADSTTGLTLDSYPQDAACYLPEHGEGTQCDYASTLPIFTPNQVETDGKGNVFLLSTSHHRVFRWSAETANFTNPIYVGSTDVLSATSPTQMSYSPQHERLYFGYPSGTITFVDLKGDLREHSFAKLPHSAGGLLAVGDYLLSFRDDKTQYIFDVNGTLTDSEDDNKDSDNSSGYLYSQAYAWNPINNHVYFSRTMSSIWISDGPSYYNALHYEEIDQTNGKITASGVTPSHRSTGIKPSIEVSQDGTAILLGGGRVYDTQSLTLRGSLSNEIIDAVWFRDAIVSISENLSGTNIQTWSSNTFEAVSELTVSGEPIALLPYEADAIQIINTSRGLSISVLSIGDHDGDGLPAWWENAYDMDDANDSNDATLDNDTDGLTNIQEYENETNPNVADTDNDGLSDADEVTIYQTNPKRDDTDSDELNDGEEVSTTLTEPLASDSDLDGFDDGEEFNRYETDPNDASSKPDPIANYFESFEDELTPIDWTTTTDSQADWNIDNISSYDGSQSLRSGPIYYSQQSAIEYSGFFAKGILSFAAKLDSRGCCDKLQFYVDGALVHNISSSTDWAIHETILEPGKHVLEWRYKDDNPTSHADSAWIDSITFVAD